MKTRHCSQYRRYILRCGEIAIRKDNPTHVSFIPKHTPVVSIRITRMDAIVALRPSLAILRGIKATV